jgi:hypothetical protein
MINDKLKMKAVPCGRMFDAFGEQIKQIRRIDRHGGDFLLFAAGVYLSMLHKDATPSFHYSIIPSFPL